MNGEIDFSFLLKSDQLNECCWLNHQAAAIATWKLFHSLTSCNLSRMSIFRGQIYV